MIEIEMCMKPDYDYLGAAVKKAAALFKKKEAATINAETFQQLLTPLKENLYNFIFKALNFSRDADDVFQETLLRAFKYRNSFKRKNPFKTWLFTIAHNEIKSYFNKNKKLPHTVNIDLEEQLNIVYDTETVVDAGYDQMVRDIYEVAQQLTPNQRRVFFLFYDQRFSIREISEITGLKEGNIKFILNQARKKIKKKLGVL